MDCPPGRTSYSASESETPRHARAASESHDDHHALQACGGVLAHHGAVADPRRARSQLAAPGPASGGCARSGCPRARGPAAALRASVIWPSARGASHVSVVCAGPGTSTARSPPASGAMKSAATGRSSTRTSAPASHASSPSSRLTITSPSRQTNPASAIRVRPGGRGVVGTTAMPQRSFPPRAPPALSRVPMSVVAPTRRAPRSQPRAMARPQPGAPWLVPSPARWPVDPPRARCSFADPATPRSPRRSRLRRRPRGPLAFVAGPTLRRAGRGRDPLRRRPRRPPGSQGGPHADRRRREQNR